MYQYCIARHHSNPVWYVRYRYCSQGARITSSISTVFDSIDAVRTGVHALALALVHNVTYLLRGSFRGPLGQLGQPKKLPMVLAPGDSKVSLLPRKFPFPFAISENTSTPPLTLIIFVLMMCSCQPLGRWRKVRH